MRLTLAVHLNVDPEATGGRMFKRKVLWVFIGLFCPEIVLTSSFEQWKKSRTLHKRVRIRQRPKDIEDPGDSDSSICNHVEDAEQPTGKQSIVQPHTALYTGDTNAHSEPILFKNVAAIKVSAPARIQYDSKHILEQRHRALPNITPK
jgi:hypothetical protein